MAGIVGSWKLEVGGCVRQINESFSRWRVGLLESWNVLLSEMFLSISYSPIKGVL